MASLLFLFSPHETMRPSCFLLSVYLEEEKITNIFSPTLAWKKSFSFSSLPRADRGDFLCCLVVAVEFSFLAETERTLPTWVRLV